ncbi:MAG: fumarylacetoacetase [Bacteroidia bacterium]|nr:fumarylacetoacetase [Bacteroidia bacterium]
MAITKLKSWVNIPDNHDFSIYNLPFGVFTHQGKSKRVGVAIGDYVLDIYALHLAGILSSSASIELFNQPFLNGLMELGRNYAGDLRLNIQKLLLDGRTELQTRDDLSTFLIPAKECELHLPVQIGDYTDFYSSMEHATNVGMMFRDPANALLPNWKHLPVGYHGRSSSIIPSGQPIHRPKGQTKADDQTTPRFGPCRLLDFELETGFFVSGSNPLGKSISTQEADNFIWGMVLFNDWSARDIQKWEYVPLGPFLAKNFASSISPWVVLMDALEPFRVAGPVQDPKVLPYLEYAGDKNIDLNLEVTIKPANASETCVTRSNFKYMYWNMNQQLAHQTSNGCNVRTGDLYGSGTISGPTVGSYGSMLEITWSGKNPVKMQDGTERKFLNDGDTVVMRGWCEKDGIRVGFGELSTQILPSN